MKSHLTLHLTAWAILFTCHGQATDKPNIVLLYIDDWAWTGTPVAMNDDMTNSSMPVLQMPNVERLAREGMKFQNAYGSPQCSPARACVLTGQSAPRHGFTVYLNSKGQEYYSEKEDKGFPMISCVANEFVSPDALTIPKALKPLGYVSAHIGKWHLRGDPGDYGYALHDGETDNNQGNTLKANLKEGEAKPKRMPADMTDPKLMFSNTTKAISFMEEQVKRGTPFYLQVSHYAMHAGSECLPATREKYANHPLVQAWYQRNGKDPATINLGDDPAVWLAMGEDLDGRIGAVLDRINALGIADNTYVILVSDNGYRHHEVEIDPDFKQPLHAQKWWLWEGGIRVPMIAKGPGIKNGTVFRGNVANYDFLPTFFEWAGGDPAALQEIDGVSLAPFMAGNQPDEAFLHRNLYFHYPHYRTTMPHSCVVSGTRKLLHFYERPEIPMLFDLAEDIGEVSNIAKAEREEHQRLFGEMMGYLKGVGARFPKPNPDYDPEVYKVQKEYASRIAWGPFEGKRSLDEDEGGPSPARSAGRTPNPTAKAAAPTGDAMQVVLHEGEHLMGDELRKFPSLGCKVKLEDDGRLLLKSDSNEKLFQSHKQGGEGPHFATLEKGQIKVRSGTPDQPGEVVWESEKPTPAGEGTYQLGVNPDAKLVIFREVEGGKPEVVWMGR